MSEETYNEAINTVKTAIYGEEVRQAIVDALNTSYEDIKLSGGDSELVDIRTGFDGTVYNTAGDAVREQIKEVQVKDDGIAPKYYLTLDSGTFSSGYTNANGDKDSEGFSYKLDVSPDDLILVSGILHSSNHPLAMVYDENDILLLKSYAYANTSGNGMVVDDYIVQWPINIPDSASYMIVNVPSNDFLYPIKVAKNSRDVTNSIGNINSDYIYDTKESIEFTGKVSTGVVDIEGNFNADTGRRIKFDVNPGERYIVSGYEYTGSSNDNVLYPLVVFATSKEYAVGTNPKAVSFVHVAFGWNYNIPVEVPKDADIMYLNSSSEIEQANCTKIYLNSYEDYYPVPLRGLFAHDGYIEPSAGYSHYIIPVSEGDELKVDGYWVGNNYYPLYCMIKTDGSIDLSKDYYPEASGSHRDIYIKVPRGYSYIVVNGERYSRSALHHYKKKINDVKNAIKYINDKIENEKESTNELLDKIENLNVIVNTNQWKGKKIVWLGTSIPAAGYFGYESGSSYPKFVGELLECTVINEAVGSSAMHCRHKNLISDNNPYGFSNNFEAVSRCLTNSHDMCQYIIDHYNDTNIFTYLAPSSMTETLKNNIFRCGYEEKIDQYLTEENQPDLWVFDHGHNDSSSDTYDPEDKYSLYNFRGACNFLFDRILSFNPHARIVMIGEYENQLHPDKSEMQLEVANAWSFDIYKQWEIYGWSQQTVTTKGGWTSSGTWDPNLNSSSPAEMTILQSYLPDGLHPHSDRSNGTLWFMANHIARWLNTVVKY